MTSQDHVVQRRQMTEWAFHSQKRYDNPFADVRVEVVFYGPDGFVQTVPAFFAGEQTWKVRFNLASAGEWRYQVRASPSDASLVQSGTFRIADADTKGYLRSTPGDAWGFRYESGSPVFIFGDTVYNLFGMAHCGGDVTSFLRRRAEQGFNLLRVRIPVSPFHPPSGYSAWQTRRTWPWGGSEQSPLFDRFNLDYFNTVDQVILQAESLGIGLEMIMEAWGFEYPFNSRQVFVPEWEELWLRYLIARYDAYNCVYFWTPLNEYEYYPNGDWNYKPVADRWAIRIARWIKATAQHGHIVSIHNGPREPPFAQRFAADPDAIDAVMYQNWGTMGDQDAWLTAGIEEAIAVSFKGWQGSAIFAEWGYEHNPDFELMVPGHKNCDVNHTRRGAWRGVFSGMGIIHGFENSWGPWMLLDRDQVGIDSLLHLRRFVTELIPFDVMRPRQDLLSGFDSTFGYGPRALATTDLACIVIYFPAGGQVTLNLPAKSRYQLDWFDPASGIIASDHTILAGLTLVLRAPSGLDGRGHIDDAVAILRQVTG